MCCVFNNACRPSLNVKNDEDTRDFNFFQKVHKLQKSSYHAFGALVYLKPLKMDLA